MTRRAVPLALATVFGVGYVPVAPGTFGSAAGLLVWWPLHSATPSAQMGVIAALFSWFSIRAEANLGRQQHLLAPIESVSVPDAEPPSNDITDLQQLG